MTTQTENPADAFIQELAQPYPDEGCSQITNHASLRPHIATMEAKPQHPQAMDAALTGTASMIADLSLSLSQRFADAAADGRATTTRTGTWARPP